MSSGHTTNPTVGDPGQDPNTRERLTPSSAKTDALEGGPSFRFVTTTSTVAIDESSKRAIRKHASRYVYRAKPQPSKGASNLPATTRRPPRSAAAGGQIHRFRLGPEGLKHTPNQPPQVSQNFTILSIKSDEEAETKPVAQPLTWVGGVPASWQIFSPSKGKVLDGSEEDNPGEESFPGISFGESGSFSDQHRKGDLINWTEKQQELWLEPFLSTRGNSIFGPSSGAMDPFNAMALPITPREQILLRYYFLDHSQVDAPLIPYCQVFFGLAVQDKASLHAVLSHYSATHRQRFQDESPAETIGHLTTAIHMITERLQDPRQCCSNGTIGAVASLIIYESANGTLPNVDFHMRGLKEMVRRRGGLDRADFPMDLKRLIAWTDLNTANDLWQKPRFPAIELPISSEPSQAQRYLEQNSFALPSTSGFDLTAAQYPFPPASQPLALLQTSSSLAQKAQPSIDSVLLELKSFTEEMARISKSLNPLNRPRISTSDKIHALERQIFDLIHTASPSTSALDQACAVAALIYMRSNLRDNICNFRIVDTAKLQAALMELGDLWQWGNDLRDREKLVWTVGFGAVSSAGRPERSWFVGLFKHVCESLGLARWEYVKAVFETVVWKNDLDAEGLRLWEEMGIEQMI